MNPFHCNLPKYKLCIPCVFNQTSLPQVVIQVDLEKKIIKLINDFRQENGDKGTISGRLTNKKLLVLHC